MTGQYDFALFLGPRNTILISCKIQSSIALSFAKFNHKADNNLVQKCCNLNRRFDFFQIWNLGKQKPLKSSVQRFINIKCVIFPWYARIIISLKLNMRKQKIIMLSSIEVCGFFILLLASSTNDTHHTLPSYAKHILGIAFTSFYFSSMAYHVPTPQNQILSCCFETSQMEKKLQSSFPSWFETLNPSLSWLMSNLMHFAHIPMEMKQKLGFKWKQNMRIAPSPVTPCVYHTLA